MVVLAIIAFALIKSLMSVVARDEGTTVAPWTPYDASTPDLTVELHATVNDDVRAFLLPVVPEPSEAEQAGISEQPRSPHSARSTRS